MATRQGGGWLLTGRRLMATRQGGGWLLTGRRLAAYRAAVYYCF